jgi:hypothetical protein
MWRYPGRLAFLAALLLSAAPAMVGAVQTDVRGNWQVNINCDLNATASIFFLLDEDVASGSTTVRYTDCGTFEVPDAIRSVSSCMFTPNPVVGQVDGTDFELPTSGFLGSEAMITPPFPFLSCSAATEILVAHHLSGTITTDDIGQAVSIDGTWVNAEVVFHDTSGATCWSITNPPSCSFDMRRNDVAVGDNVSVSPRAKTTVTFEHVTSPGTVEVMPLTQADGTVPEQFEVLGNGTVSIFYDVRTTAMFAGTITSCFPYPDANGDGIVDGSNPPLDETELRVLHGENGVFVDRTVSLDTTAKIICGATTSLSQLAIAHGPAAPSNDHPFEGGKLVLTRKPTGREVARVAASLWAPLPARGSPDDPQAVGAVLELFAAPDQTVGRFDMPAELWTARQNGRVYQFFNPKAPNSVSPVTVAVLNARRRRLRIESRAVGLALDGPQRGVGVRLTLGSSRYCVVYTAFRRDVANHIIATGYSAPPLDCADRRMRFAVLHSH